MTTKKRESVLFLEERIAVVRAMCNEDSFDLKTASQIGNFMLRCIRILDGEVDAVPKHHKDIVRRP